MLMALSIGVLLDGFFSECAGYAISLTFNKAGRRLTSLGIFFRICTQLKIKCKMNSTYPATLGEASTYRFVWETVN